MKKYIFSILALAGFAACSTDSELNETIAPEQKESFTLNASIATPDESRVLIEGERFTEVSWEAGDFISIRSASGVGENGRAVLEAESAGSSNVRFTGDLAFTQNTDTYYAVYPERTFDNATISVDYTTQDGSAKKAALLVGTAVDAYKYDVNMTFEPVNALIHVTLTEAPATASKVVLQRMGSEKEITPIYSYNVEDGTITLSGSSLAITVTPSSNSFFIALPAGLTLDNYELVFTVGDKTFAKGFAGKTFEKGTTTNVNVAWELPSVKLGAMTSYSYYANGNATMANKCDNSTIYLESDPDGNAIWSTYSGIQNAMIEAVGFNVGSMKVRLEANGDYYIDGVMQSNLGEGITNYWDKSKKRFRMPNQGGMSWTAHKVEAFIETKHNGTITSSDDLHVTGLPYTPSSKSYLINTDSSNPYPWQNISSGNNDWNGTSVEMEGGTTQPKVATPKFAIPSEKSVNISFSCHVKRTSGGLKYNFDIWTYNGDKDQKIYERGKDKAFEVDVNATSYLTSSSNSILFHNYYGATLICKATISNVSITYR